MSVLITGNRPGSLFSWGMFTPATAISLQPGPQHALESLARAGTAPQRPARKCEVILLASQGVANNAIARQTGLSRPTGIATRAAFLRDGLEGTRRRQKPKRSRRALTAELEQKILKAFVWKAPADVILDEVPGFREAIVET